MHCTLPAAAQPPLCDLLVGQRAPPWAEAAVLWSMASLVGLLDSGPSGRLYAALRNGGVAAAAEDLSAQLGAALSLLAVCHMHWLLLGGADVDWQEEQLPELARRAWKARDSACAHI